MNEEETNRYLLRLERVLEVLTLLSSLTIIFIAAFLIPVGIATYILIAISLIILLIGTYFALKIEHDAGYYECQHCHQSLRPDMKTLVLAPHNGRSRWMKCPYCHRRSFMKKTLTKSILPTTRQD